MVLYGLGAFLLFFPLFLIGALFFIFWIIMLVDVASRKFKNDDKIVWILVVILVGIMGALIYYFVIYRKDKSLRWFWITLLALFILSIIILFILVLFYLGIFIPNRIVWG